MNPLRLPGLRPKTSTWPPWIPLAVLVAALTPVQAATFNSNFSTDPGGAAVGVAVIEDNVLKLNDLAALIADPPKRLPLHGSYILPDFHGASPVQSFTATFKAAVGGGTSLGAQGFSFVLANDLDPAVIFREGGGASKGLVLSFDTIDNLGGFEAEGNEPDDAPGIIVKIGGTKVAVRRFNGIPTYPPNSTAARFANVEVKLDPDGTLDVTYDGVKVYDNVGIGYTPITGQFGFGAGTGENTAAIRNNHWIDDVNISTTAVGAGAFVASKTPGSQNVSPAAEVTLVIQNLASPTVGLKFDGVTVTPTVTSAGNTRTVKFDPPGLLSSETRHTVELTYETTKTFAFEFTVAKYVTIPATAKAKAGAIDTGSSGFRVKVTQQVSPAPNSLVGAERQLLVLPNLANLSAAAADGTFALTTINFDDNQDGVGTFTTDDAIPGYPGSTDETELSDNVVHESTTYLELPAGLVTLGVQSDDGFKVSIGSDPRDVTSSAVGSFEGVANSTFFFAVEEAGIYGARLLWYEVGGDANCEFFSVKSDGSRVLINDRATAGHIKAYRNRATPAGPYIASVKPAPGESSVSPKLNIVVLLTEDTTVLNPASIKLQIKDTVVSPTVTKNGKQTTVKYTHAGSVEGGTYPVAITYADGAGNAKTASWAFSTSPGPCENVTGPAAKGYWTFDDGTLKGTIGSDIAYIDNALSIHYSFGTSGQGAFADVPGINGKPVKFLAIPRNDNGDDFKRTGIRVKPGISPSGGGKNANIWTAIIDIYWGQGHGFGSLLRTHDLNQNNDADLFWRASDGGYGKGCCSNYDAVDPAHNMPREAWGRLVLVADLTSNPKRFAKYYNGFKHREDVSGDGANIDGRFSLPGEIFLFNDGDDNEQSTALVSAIQFREGALTDEEITKLGGPNADGIPAPVVQETGVASQWEFSGSLAARKGQAIRYIDDSISSQYSFGTSGQGAFADIPAIGGQPVQFLAIPRNDNGDDFKRTGLRVNPGLAKSGGGNNANVWTAVFDIYWGQGHGFGSLLRTHDLNQNNDADLFWRASDGGYGKGCCSNYDAVDPAHNMPREAWGRLVLVADLTSTPKRFTKYYNGFKHREDVSGDGANIDGRFSLPSEIFLFNDGDDNEQSTALISSLQFRPVALTDAEVAALGGPSAAGIPEPQTVSPNIKSHLDFSSNLNANIGSPAVYIDNAIASHYSFGTTGQGALADVPGINGRAAQVLVIPRNENGDDFKRTGLRIKPGLEASSGGKNANVWTAIIDLYWGQGHGFGSLLRTHDLNQNNDADLFWRASDGGYGKGCCSNYDAVDPAHNMPREAWGRLVLVADLTSTPKRFAKYYNGFKHREDVSGDGANIDGRFSLPSEIFLFNDGDDNEQSTVYVNAVQFRNVAMTDEEVAALGGPNADGPPLTSAAADVCLPLATATAAIQLVAADSLGGVFAVVAGATINTGAKTITVPIPTKATQFFRVRGSNAKVTVAVQGGNLVISY